MNKLLRILSCTLTAALLAGCSLTNKDPRRETTPNDGSYTTDDIKTEAPAYTWVLKPSVTADNIIVFDASQVDTDNELNNAYENYAVIYSKGKYGIIDYNGKVVIKPQYDDYYTCWCGEVTLVNYIDQRKGLYDYCSVDSSGQVVNYAPDHVDNRPSYYRYKDKIFVKNKQEAFGKVYTGKKAVVVGEASVKDVGEGNYKITPKKGSKYGIAKNGKLISDPVYTAYYAPAYKGAGLTGFALKNAEGKWGYVNSAGKTIIDFSCDGDTNAYNGFLIDNFNKIHPYLFSDNYIPININGSYAYYDKTGSCIIKAGEFEQARPSYNGKAWVKKDGKWGIIKIGSDKDDKSNKTATAKTKKKQTAATTYNNNYYTNNYNYTQNQTAQPVQTTQAPAKPKATAAPKPAQTQAPVQTQPPVQQTDPPQTQAPAQPEQSDE